jgi:hypothetical protein
MEKACEVSATTVNAKRMNTFFIGYIDFNIELQKYKKMRTNPIKK